MELFEEGYSTNLGCGSFESKFHRMSDTNQGYVYTHGTLDV